LSLNINNEEAVRLARQLAAATRESITSAVTAAVRERLDRLKHSGEAAGDERADRIREIATP